MLVVITRERKTTRVRSFGMEKADEYCGKLLRYKLDNYIEPGLIKFSITSH